MKAIVYCALEPAGTLTNSGPVKKSLVSVGRRCQGLTEVLCSVTLAVAEPRTGAVKATASAWGAVAMQAPAAAAGGGWGWGGLGFCGAPWAAVAAWWASLAVAGAHAMPPRPAPPAPACACTWAMRQGGWVEGG